MDAALALSLALSCVNGFALGVFGGGGSILAVPMLVFVTRLAPSAAVGMSLAIVGATSLAASYAYWQSRDAPDWCRPRWLVLRLEGSPGSWVSGAGFSSSLWSP
jgi:uncharacterized membrane protein YfcA